MVIHLFHRSSVSEGISQTVDIRIWVIYCQHREMGSDRTAIISSCM